MSTTTSSETFSPDTEPRQPEHEVQTAEHVGLPTDEASPALTENRTNDSSQIQTSPMMPNCALHYYSVWLMLFSGFATIFAGMTGRHGNGWCSTLTYCYICWTFGVLIHLFLNLSTSESRLKHCASHLACCAITIYFLAAALKISSADLPMYIPMGINLGFLFSVGLQQMSLPTKLQILGYLGLGYSYQVVQPPILPLVELKVANTAVSNE